jgi:hypothetical protein
MAFCVAISKPFTEDLESTWKPTSEMGLRLLGNLFSYDITHKLMDTRMEGSNVAMNRNYRLNLLISGTQFISPFAG